jgi:ribonuclease-3
MNQRPQLPVSLLGNAVEAIIGAIYLDAPRTSVIITCEDIILRWLEAEIHDLPQRFSQTQAKQTLQIVAQKYFDCLPKYIDSEKGRADSSPTFTAEVVINDRVLGKGQASSKKGAQQIAAWQAVLLLRTEHAFTELRD